MSKQDSDEARAHKKLGLKFVILMWLLLIALLYFLFNDVLEKDYNPNQQVSSQQINNINTVVLQRNRYGHYVTQGKINNEKVTLLLDTGATDISIPYNIAKKLNLTFGAEQRYQTANGIIVGNLTTLNSVSIGNIELKNVRASINPKMDRDEILLGMSFLKDIEFTQRGNTLILRQ